jgi:translocation and assembly module TamB
VIDGARGFPADLSIRINEVRYTDGAFFTTTLSGELELNGPLQGGGGTLGGRIDLGQTEISVSEGLGAGAAATLDQVTHVRPPPRVQETLRRAAVGAPSPPEASGRGGLQLDLRVVARNQIFVRGRGLDVELGGELRITGPTTDIRPVGQFDLRRGRLNLIGQRIEFQEGSLQLVGDLDPRILFVARTTSGDITAIVTVTGRASEPEIVFSSEPPLPEDEVLSHILFNRASQNLSPFQAAQLAAAAAELAGRGGNGLLSQIRSSLGFDDLDIITNEEGEAALSAGRYFGEDDYVDVQAAADGKSKIELVYEHNERVTARGSVGSDGNSTLGIFFERDF